MTAPARDHGGGIDAAAARHGGQRGDWIDLSTGINPRPYPLPPLPHDAWTALPDRAAMAALEAAARRHWRVPAGAQVVAAPGASALIVRLPELVDGDVHVPGPTYNEHAAAFGSRASAGPDAPVHVWVHPNNPDGRLWPDPPPPRRLTVVDESFGDTLPDTSHVAQAARPDVAILKSFGKFWGLAGLRLGFLIAAPPLADAMRAALGPWPVSGPALAVAARALADTAWAEGTRARLAADAARLDRLMTGAGAAVAGGTSLFRLYEVDDAADWQARLARARIWTRTFTYNSRWLRLGLPPDHGWPRLEAVFAGKYGTAGGAMPQASGVLPAP